MNWGLLIHSILGAWGADLTDTHKKLLPISNFNMGWGGCFPTAQDLSGFAPFHRNIGTIFHLWNKTFLPWFLNLLRPPTLWDWMFSTRHHNYYTTYKWLSEWMHMPLSLTQVWLYPPWPWNILSLCFQQQISIQNCQQSKYIINKMWMSSTYSRLEASKHRS